MSSRIAGVDAHALSAAVLDWVAHNKPALADLYADLRARRSPVLVGYERPQDLAAALRVVTEAHLRLVEILTAAARAKAEGRVQ
jgi:hypothetical protein